MSVNVLDLIELEGERADVALSGGDVLRHFQSLLSSRRSRAADFLSCAQSFEFAGLDREALSACDEAIRRDGLCWEGLVFRAELLLGQFIKLDDGGTHREIADRALSDYKRALSFAGTTSGDLVRGYAVALLLVGDYGHCVEFVEGRLPSHHTFGSEVEADLRYALGFAYVFLDKSDKAARAFERMKELDATNEYAVFGLVIRALVFSKADVGEVTEDGLSSELSSSFRVLRERGCGSFLDVARAMG